MQPKSQRLLLGVAALVALGSAGLLAASTLGETSTYFYAPSDIAAKPPSASQVIRLGGMVKEGSVARSADGLTLTFTVTDYGADTRVSYTGIVPDLFREKQGVVATGTLRGDRFVASELLAKHDENYMPPEVAKALDRQAKSAGS
jgi:cytochrome c-type biogenesis protein CcmE